MPRLYLDFETRSLAPLKAYGAWKYAEHPSTEIICMGLAIDDGSPDIIYEKDLEYYVQYFNYSYQTEGVFVAHNAEFEQAIWHHIMVKRYGALPLPPERWSCTAALAARYGLPRSLEGACSALKLEHQKNPDGQQLLKTYCIPDKRTGTFQLIEDFPDDLRDMGIYCMDDVRAERALDQTLPDNSFERPIWIADQRINARGVKLDMPFIHKAIELTDHLIETDRRGLLHCGITKVGSTKQIRAFCAQQGVWLEDLREVTVLETLARLDIPMVVREVLEFRLNSSKASVKKYKAAKLRVQDDGRARGLFKYAGAHTLRWSGQSIQTQNLYRGTIGAKNDKVIDLFMKDDLNEISDRYERQLMTMLAECLRGMFIAEPGKTLIGGDYSKIECVGLAMLANQENLVMMLREGIDIYVNMAANIYGIDEVAVSGIQRHLGKTAILGLGYGMGVDRFHQSCLKDGIDIDEGTADLAVQTYRQTYPEIVDFWKWCQESAHSAVHHPGECFKSPEHPGMSFQVTHDFLFIRLPSGRFLSYFKPIIEDSMAPWGDMIPTLHYRAPKGAGMWDEKTYGAKLVENIVQGLCRDLMAEAIVRLEKADLPVVLHTHDEVVCEVSRETETERFEELLTGRPLWAANWPVTADCWKRPRYYKA